MARIALESAGKGGFEADGFPVEMERGDLLRAGVERRGEHEREARDDGGGGAPDAADEIRGAKRAMHRGKRSV